MSTPTWGNFLIFLVLLVDTLAIFFLIRKVKALESLDEGDATARIDLGKRIRKLETKLKALESLDEPDTVKINYIAEKLEDLETKEIEGTRNRGNIRKRVLALEKKLKAILDEE